MNDIAHFFPQPWRFEEEGHLGGPCVKDASGNIICAFFWPIHPSEETERAEEATYQLGRWIASNIPERERCARLIEGVPHKEHYRIWPGLDWGDRANDSELVRFCDAIAAIVRERTVTSAEKASDELPKAQ